MHLTEGIGVHYSCTDGISDLQFLLSEMSGLHSWARPASSTLDLEAAALFSFQLFPSAVGHSLPHLDCLSWEANNTSGMF